MVFYRKYRRTGSGYARRGRSGYSMYKLYRKRNSAAQARQIYGLNKKMKRIQRLTKPEINIAPLVQGSQLSASGGSLVNGVRIYGPTRLTNLLTSDSSATSSAQTIEGRFARIQNITMKGVFTYDTASTGELDPVDLQRMVCYLRIVIFQTKASRATDINFNDVFSTTTAGSLATSAGSPYDLNSYSMIRAPLKYGLARVAKVMSDKTYMISDTKQAVNVKTKLRYVRNWYKAPSDPGAKGDVWMVTMIYNQTSDSTDDVSACRFNYISKCVYTDA